tara:strand:- start:894 stop:1514 length:621 start_codon:yes stop_codon:yes gene_type:complete
MIDEKYTKYIAQNKRPVPGQSLTRDPDSPAPYEKAPEFTNVHKAIQHLFSQVIDEKSYIPIMQAVANDTPVMDLVQLVLFEGFQTGKWNPDLMIMLVEPLAYMIIALAERADIDVVIYRDEEEDEEIDEQVLGVSFDEERLESLKKAAKLGKVPAGAIPKEIEEKIKALPVIAPESLLASPVPASPSVEEAPQEPSLMAPPAQQQA